MKFLHRLNNYCLYLLVFSITFENWDPFKLVGSYSVTYLTSILYIGTWIPMIRFNYDSDILKKYVIPLLLFILVGFISTAFNSIQLLEFKQAYNYRVLLLVVLMMLMAGHISSDKTLIKSVLDIYVASILLVFVLVSFGIGDSYEKGRLMLFGENPNLLGMKAVIAFLIIAARALNEKFSVKRLMIALVLGIPMISLALLTASRGAFLSIFLGFAVLIFFQRMPIFKKLFMTFVGSIFSVFFFLYVMENNQELQRRLMLSVEQGDIGRNDLWLGAIELISNNLIIGVGFTGVLPAMYQYSGHFNDPHNIFFYVLISSGIIGFVFFMIFLWRIILNQYRTYRITGQTVYLLLFLIMMINMAKAGGAIGKILFWFLFSVLIAHSTIVSKFNKQDTED